MLALKVRIFWHSLFERPLSKALAGGMALVVGVLIYRGTLWFLDFLSAYPFVAGAVVERSLGLLFLLLMAAVLLSALPGALAVLFGSEDLHLLLAWPIPAGRVFAYKVFETFLSAAALPTLLSWPVLLALGVHAGAPPIYYPLAAVISVLVFFLPVALGATLALFFLRLAPAGRAREWAAAGSAVIGGLLVYALRAARPEAILKEAFRDPEALAAYLAAWAKSGPPLLPSTWAARATSAALEGRVEAALMLLALLAGLWFLFLVWVAGHVYRAGWVRGLEGSFTPREARPPALWERILFGFGPYGMLFLRDLRLFFRDATRVSELLLVGVLVLLYWTSLAALPLEGLVFQRVVGFLHAVFEGLVVVAVGLRLAFPLFGAEASGRWVLATAPLGPGALLLTRFFFALFLMLPLGAALGFLVPLGVGLPAAVVPVSGWTGLAAALAAAGLGVGVGAIWPARGAVHAGEVALGVGGLFYMASGLLFAAWLAVLDAYPLYRLLSGLPFWGTEAALLWAGLLWGSALLVALLPLFVARWRAS